MKRFDALVIGAGPAGSTAAMLLSRGGWSVALVEKSAFPRRKVCGEFVSGEALSLLAAAGVADEVLLSAGPAVREVAVYAGDTLVAAPMPAARGATPYGHALGRDRLDSLLLGAARGAGATVYQPCRVRRCDVQEGDFVAAVEGELDGAREMLRAPIVIAAHGSWDAGGLPFAGARSRKASDLLAFKARLAGGALPPGRMPLLAFPGGYGGLVHTDGGEISFSCCIRRDALAQVRAQARGIAAGAAVLAHVLETCRGAREALGGAERVGAWLASGPLRPGVRAEPGGGYFLLGNAKGEAHPIVAEGISMAIQSAWLLAQRLLDAPRAGGTERWNAVARGYDLDYRRNFEPRIYAASAFSSLAMRPRAAAVVAGTLAIAPGLLVFGARLAGKARALRASA